MMGIKENFKRGTLEMLILHLLKGEEMYGYQLTQEIGKRTVTWNSNPLIINLLLLLSTS